ncbi:hypothetical protein PR048_012704 [Dryococelus australis]|uniref:Uncharacterized protein n=1 Tax=Dryococelus australis TaxID=614101 RepID=A0ABQ9HRJ9_9NEOP|nr:hypothetical protein PR048_012704 [Dryococelus australis]
MKIESKALKEEVSIPAIETSFAHMTTPSSKTRPALLTMPLPLSYVMILYWDEQYANQFCLFHQSLHLLRACGNQQHVIRL